MDDFIPLSWDYLEKIKKNKLAIFGYPEENYKSADNEGIKIKVRQGGLLKPQPELIIEE